MGLFKKKEKPLPQATGVTIDMTKTYWGHNFDADRTEEDETYRGWIIYGNNVAVGDIVKWATEYGCAHALVTSVEWCRDPQDMYFFSAVVVEREIV